MCDKPESKGYTDAELREKLARITRDAKIDWRKKQLENDNGNEA